MRPPHRRLRPRSQPTRSRLQPARDLSVKKASGAGFLYGKPAPCVGSAPAPPEQVRLEVDGVQELDGVHGEPRSEAKCNGAPLPRPLRWRGACFAVRCLRNRTACFAAVSTIGALFTVSAPALAFDTEVNATSAAQAYSFGSP